MIIHFYSGEHCHLCDLAQQLLDDLDTASSLQVSKIDVKSDHQLFHLYGARIPVLKRIDNDQELGWPFDMNDLREFVR